MFQTLSVDDSVQTGVGRQGHRRRLPLKQGWPDRALEVETRTVVTRAQAQPSNRRDNPVIGIGVGQTLQRSCRIGLLDRHEGVDRQTRNGYRESAAAGELDVETAQQLLVDHEAQLGSLVLARHQGLADAELTFGHDPESPLHRHDRVPRHHTLGMGGLKVFQFHNAHSGHQEWQGSPPDVARLVLVLVGPGPPIGHPVSQSSEGNGVLRHLPALRRPPGIDPQRIGGQR